VRKFVIILPFLATAAVLTNGAFEDVSSRSGVQFVLRNGATPEKHQIESMPGGVAVFDFDNDGKLDIYFVNGARQPDLAKADASYYNRLYRNKGDGTFEDVTNRAGVRGRAFDIAVAAADFDNDGYTDLYVTGVRGNALYRNRGDGTFEDVTRKAGVAGANWAVTAGWFDYDNDGRLDLFVANYVKWDPAKEPFCGAQDHSYRSYCHPKFYEGLPNTLYHNNGDGTFTDVSEASGIAAHVGKGMGVSFADYDGDGMMDIFVANDTVPNFLFHNLGNGKFEEVGMMAGVAYNDNGQTLSSMGTDFRDVDNDGREDIFYTALVNERFPLFRNQGGGLFFDVTGKSKIGSASLQYSGWSTGIFDFDNDGLKDIFVACGDVQDNSELYSSIRSRQENLLLINKGGGTFVAQTVGKPAMHRGVAFGDFDDDGRIDAVVTRIGETPALFHNRLGAANHWLALRLTGTKSNRDAIGAKVHIVTAAGQQWNHVTTAVGYASSSDRTVHFGLGNQTEVKLIEIRWPSGKLQKLENIKADQLLRVSE
jgi:hypothetical protein